MLLQQEITTLAHPPIAKPLPAKVEKKVEVKPQPKRSAADREQSLVNIGAIALLFSIGLFGGLAAWLFLAV